jgi:hypothetical protein
MTKLVDIITVVYSETDDIINYVESLKKQSHLIKLWIVINGAINKNTINISEELAGKYDWIKLIHSEINLGLAGGNNLAIPYLKLKYTAIINPDTIIPQNTFKILIEKLNKNQDSIAIAPINLYEDFSPHSSYHKHWTVFHVLASRILPGIITNYFYNKILRNFNEDCEVLFASGSFLLTYTNIFKNIEGYDPHYFLTVEDVCDLCIRLRQGDSDKKIIVTPVAKIVHLGGRSTVGNRYLAQWGAFDGHIYHFTKHNGFAQGLLVYFICLASILLRIIIYSGLVLSGKKKDKLVMNLKLFKSILINSFPLRYKNEL